jgi:hypothetical protein
MNKTTFILKKHQAILFFAIFTALVFHAAAIWMMHGMRMDFLPGRQSFIEQQLQEVLTTQQAAERKEELRQRNEELSQIFSQLQPEITQNGLTEHEINIPVPEPTEFQTPFERNIPDDASLVDEHPEHLPAITMAEETYDAPIQPAILPDQDIPSPTAHHEILFSNDLDLAYELQQATDVLEGLLETGTPELIADPNAIQIGKHEEAFFPGNALKTRSGLLDEGQLDNDDVGMLPKPSEREWLAFKPDTPDTERGWHAKFSFPQEDFVSHAPQLPAGNVDTQRAFVVNSLETIASSRDFTLSVEYTFRKDAPGYIFRLTLSPKPDVKFKKIKQNYFFLVDRSHSIRYARYEASKAAVRQSIMKLRPEDTFNILIFDDKIVRYAPASVPATPENLEQAKTFLHQQKHGGFLAATDLYSSLGDIIPAAVPEKEVNTAILLSDGDTYLSSEKQRETIAKWTARNAGKVSLYSLAAGKGNNLALLDLLSTFNKGGLFYAKTDNEIPETMQNLLEQVKHPIGKDIVATAITTNKDLRILLLPPEECLPNLNQNVPYVIYGTINKLEDFTIFLQGRYYDKWLDIKHQVSFKDLNAVHSPALDKMWAMQQSYSLYKKYLITGQSSVLFQIRNLLLPFNLPVAFK